MNTQYLEVTLLSNSKAHTHPFRKIPRNANPLHCPIPMQPHPDNIKMQTQDQKKEAC